MDATDNQTPQEIVSPQATKTLKRLTLEQIQEIVDSNPHIPLTERGLTQAMVQVCKNQFFYLVPEGIWYVSRGHIIEPDITGSLMRRLHEIIKIMLDLSKTIPDEVIRAQIRILLRRVDQQRHLREVIERLRFQKDMIKRNDTLNTKKDCLNTPKGIVLLKERRVVAPNPGLWTLSTNFSYTAEATSPSKFLSFLSDFCCGRDDLREFILRILGYSLTGHTDEQAIFLLHGSGGNGKTVLFDVLRGVLGKFVGSIDKRTLVEGDDATHYLTRLEGLRLAVISETSSDDVWDDGRLKALVGEQVIHARKLYENGRDYTISAKIFVYTNTLPRSKARDNGFYRRLRPIPCDMVVHQENRIKNYGAVMVQEEGEAIFKLLVDQAALWYEQGLPPVPASMEEVLQFYRSDNDQLGEFVASETEKVKEAISPGKVLYDRYLLWVQAKSLNPLSNQSFYRELENRGFRRVVCKSRGITSLHGIQVRRTRTENTGNTDDSAKFS